MRYNEAWRMGRSKTLEAFCPKDRQKEDGAEIRYILPERITTHKTLEAFCPKDRQKEKGCDPLQRITARKRLQASS